MTRRPAAGADRSQMPTVAGAAEKDVTNKKGGNQRRCVDRNAKNAPFTEKVPGIAADRVGGEYGGEPFVEQVDTGAQDNQRNQRRQKRPRLKVADQNAITGADDRPRQ